MSTLTQFFGGGGSQVIEVFAIGGGGNGGSPPGPGAAGTATAGGGGGGGQVTYATSIVTPGKTYTITIGGAGSSTTFNDITAFGGGNGANAGSSFSQIYEGSAGGGGTGPATGVSAAPFFPNAYSHTDYLKLQNTGGAGGSTPGPGVRGGGGGGAAGAGSGGPTTNPTFPMSAQASGGAGLPAYKIGIPGSVFGAGGAGGVGASGPSRAGGANGAANTGEGGQGGVTDPAVFMGSTPGGNGGSGALIIRFPTAFSAASVTGDTPVTPQPGYYVYRWNSGPGTITFN